MAARHGSALAPCHERQCAGHRRGVRWRHGAVVGPVAVALPAGAKQRPEISVREQIAPVVFGSCGSRSVCAHARLGAVSVPELFLRRCGVGEGGRHPFAIEDRCNVLAVVRKARSLYDAVEAQYFSDCSASIIPVPDCSRGKYYRAFGIFDSDRVSVHLSHVRNEG